MRPEVRRKMAIVLRNSLGQIHERQAQFFGRDEDSSSKHIKVFYGTGTLAHKGDFERFAHTVLC